MAQTRISPWICYVYLPMGMLRLCSYISATPSPVLTERMVLPGKDPDRAAVNVVLHRMAGALSIQPASLSTSSYLVLPSLHHYLPYPTKPAHLPTSSACSYLSPAPRSNSLSPSTFAFRTSRPIQTEN
eukprot:3057461-Rhodomonas_salina.2